MFKSSTIDVNKESTLMQRTLKGTKAAMKKEAMMIKFLL